MLGFKLKNILLILYLLTTAGYCLASDNSMDSEEIYRIRVDNVQNGLIQVSMDQGSTYSTVGRVKTLANARIKGFAAASYIPHGSVAATAVHGIRIKTGQFAEGIGKAQKPMLFSITPSEFSKIPEGYGGHRPRSSAIYTDIYTGHSIFRNESPFVGNPVYREREHHLEPLPEDYIPAEGDIYVILVQKPLRVPSEIVFENRNDGTVTANYPDGTSEIIAHVDRPVKGIGRYDATTFTGVGAINTSHGGVLTVSTAPVCPPGTCEGGPVETRGGFMVQPYYHSNEQGDGSPQVMVVGPKDKAKPHMEGTPPLFSGFINLSSISGHPENSYRAQIKIDDGEWENLPKVIGKVDGALTAEGLQSYFAKRGDNRKIERGVTAVRLLFPKYDPKVIAADLAKETSDYMARTIKAGITSISGTIGLSPKNPPSDTRMTTFYIDGAPIYMCNGAHGKFDWDSRKVPNGLHTIDIEMVRDSVMPPTVESRRLLIKN